MLQLASQSTTLPPQASKTATWTPFELLPGADTQLLKLTSIAISVHHAINANHSGLSTTELLPQNPARLGSGFWIDELDPEKPFNSVTEQSTGADEQKLWLYNCEKLTNRNNKITKILGAFILWYIEKRRATITRLLIKCQQ